MGELRIIHCPISSESRLPLSLGNIPPWDLLVSILILFHMSPQLSPSIAFRMFEGFPLMNKVPSTPVPHSPEFTGIQKITRKLFLSSTSTVAVAAERLRSDIHPTYLLLLSDGSRCILKCSPSLPTRLLRQEQRRIEDQSRILNLLNRRTDLPVPRRIKYESHSSSLTLQAPYLTRSYIQGTPLSEIQSRLSTAERSRIDQSLGASLRVMSSLTARSFGTPHAVHAGAGYGTWREAFLIMFEAVLRDAEDTLVSIPYDVVRSCVAAHADALDAPATPRLAVLDACVPERVLVDAETKQVTGLLGIGNVLWGDADMAAALHSPSAAFLDGYGRREGPDGASRHRRKYLYVPTPLHFPPFSIPSLVHWQKS